MKILDLEDTIIHHLLLDGYPAEIAVDQLPKHTCNGKSQYSKMLQSLAGRQVIRRLNVRRSSRKSDRGRLISVWGWHNKDTYRRYALKLKLERGGAKR